METKRIAVEANNLTIGYQEKKKSKVVQSNIHLTLYSGEVTALLSALSTVELTDININDPELDEIFMSYYAKEDK